MKQNSFFIVFIFMIALIHCPAVGQLPNDTIILSPVEISANKNAIQKNSRIDSVSDISVSLSSAIEVVKSYTPLFIKEYSPGGISTVAFRGTSASHTIVMLDGFPVNPAMSGQADFSVIPPYLYDRLEITGNPESLLLSSEALGGAISMYTNPNEKQQSGIRLRCEGGSFGNVGSGLSVHFKFGNLLFRSRGFWHKAENDFTFINNSLTHRPVENRINAAFRKFGLMQEVYYIKKQHVIFLKLTGVSNFQQLPAMLLQPQIEGNETMDNRTLRATTGYSVTKGKHFISLKSMASEERWEYINRSAAVSGMNFIHTVDILADWQYRFHKNAQVKVQWFSDYKEVKSPNYVQTQNMLLNRLTLNGTFNFSKFEIQPVLHVMHRYSQTPAMSGALLLHRALLNHKLFLFLSVGRSIRYPGLNDLYWNPGGNPDLLPEHSLSGSGAIEYRPFKWWSVRGGYTFHDVDNWIVWQPGITSSYWSPVNIRRVISNTIEFLNVIEHKIGHWSFRSVGSYSYCRSVDISEPHSSTFRKQLIYVPMHNAAHSLIVKKKHLSVTMRSFYTGKRFTRADNVSYMPAHFHHDILIGYNFRMKNIESELFFALYNFTGENYQIIAWQPMPRQHFRTGIQIMFGSNKE